MSYLYIVYKCLIAITGYFFLTFRLQNKSESVQQPKANTHANRARPLNRKILDPPKLPQRKKSISQSTEFQVLNNHNSTPPANDNSLSKSQNSRSKDKFRSPIKLKSCNTDKVHPIKDGELASSAKHNTHQPPIELFKKLSLKTESQTKVISSSRPSRVTKALKENVPKSLQQDFRRCVGKPNHHETDRRVTEVNI
ncbi:uncharacterized protein [Rutidosis leptorrhynchoides]|uniref:uncharacterized protein isoform X2 n=1 Tax=Rutidosis leptorrhynchoides TaxID=125765 RepID=UPI003A9A285B